MLKIWQQIRNTHFTEVREQDSFRFVGIVDPLQIWFEVSKKINSNKSGLQIPTTKVNPYDEDKKIETWHAASLQYITII